MRDRIRERLAEYRAEALNSIAVAVNKTKSKHAGSGTLASSMFHLAINKDNETGFAEYMDRSAGFIPILRLSDLRLPNRGGRWT